MKMKKLFTLLTMLVACSAISMAETETWTVAGSAAALNGDENWSTTNADNDMTLTGDVYTLTVTDCTLEKGATYEYKVVKDHAWTTAYPGSNKTFKVSETAVYTVVYTFDPSTTSVTETTTKTGEAGAISHTYTVAGSSASLFGTEWAVTETANDMAETTTGIYTFTKENVLLDGAEIKFKVAVDHAWGTAYPASDWEIGTSYDEYDGEGYYDVTITFTESTKNIAVDLKKHNTTYAVTFVNKQSWEKVNAWAWNSDNSGFNGMAWPGVALEKTGTDGGYDVYTYSFSNHNAAMPVGILFNDGGEAQTSDFTFENGAKYEPVTSIEVSMTKDFETFSSKYALDFTSTAISAYRATISDGKVVLTKVGKVPANTGVLLQKNGATKEDVPTTYGTESFGENLFVATDGTTDITASAEGSYNYVLQTNDDVQGFYNVTSTITAPAAGKAYLHTTTALASEAKAREAWIFAGGETTGINTVREAVNDNRYYNLAGQRVSQPGRGLYIVNGKKVVIK